MKKTLQPSDRKLSEAERCADTLDLGAGVGFLARIISTRVTAVYEVLTGQSEITPRQFATLLILHQRDTLTLTDLADSICVDRSTLSEMVARMVKRKLLTKSANGADGRSATVSLAPAGKTALLAIVLAVMQQQKVLLAPLPKAERARFIRNMKLVAGQPIQVVNNARTNLRERP
jgi:DNA-binding MarR family transcriptional regulator